MKARKDEGVLMREAIFVVSLATAEGAAVRLFRMR